MHSLIRHPGILLLAAAAAAMFAGCGPKDPAAIKKPPYPTLGLKPMPPIFKDTVMERTDVTNTGPLPVTSYGLVVNLRQSGDSRAPQPVREWMIKEMYRHGLGSLRVPGYRDLTPERVLADQRNAIVMVGAYLPPGARHGQRVDVVVQALPGSETASLAGGSLYQCDLRLLGANPLNPGGAVNKFVEARGPVFINPAYALETPKQGEGVAMTGARIGMVLGGGYITNDRPIHLRLRTPQWNISRAVEAVIQQRFQDRTVAAAQDEGYLHLFVPENYQGNWDHFVQVINHLYINITPATAAIKAQDLVDAARFPGAPLDDISYALEGLGKVVLPHLPPLLAHESAAVRYAAARAGAYLGDTASEDTLIRIATTTGDPFRLNAVQVLGEIPNNPEINRAMTTCLDADESLVRIGAYKILTANRDPHVLSTAVGESFVLDIVESKGKPMVYATRVGEPRIAVFGPRAALNMPMTFSAFDHKLTIANTPTQPQLLSIFYRGDELPETVKTLSRPYIAEVVARLGGGGDQKLQFGYGDVVAILQSMADGGKLAASFVLQDMPGVEDFATTPDFTADGRPAGDPNGKEAVDDPSKAAVGVNTPNRPGNASPGGRAN
jgi:hypothetical protein